MIRLQPLFDQARVRLMLVLGLTDAAVRQLEGMLARDPANTYALATRAHLRLQSKQTNLAIPDLRAVCEHTPESAPTAASAWYNLGFVLNEVKDYEEAEQAFRTALRLNPKLDLAWYGLGLTLISQRRFDEAADSLKQNTKLQPMSPYGWYQLARVHMDRKAPEEAAKVIEHLRGFEPKVAAQLVRETGVGA